jgi:thiol-disulfide isomerase/thioredoxin
MDRMMKNIKVLLLSVFCLLNTINAFAQQDQVRITGTVTQKKNYVITIVGKANDKSFRASQYFVDTTTNKFSIVVPFRGNVAYEMQVTVMKMGHRRLEVDYTANFPLQVSANQNLNVSINSALLKQPKMALTIVKQPAKFANVSVSGLKDTKIGMDLSFGKVVEGKLQTIQTSFIAKGDSSFIFSLPIEKEGFYYLSTLSAKKRLYLKPNDQINLVFDSKSLAELSASKSTAENQLIAQWEQLSSPLLPFVALGAKPDRDAFSAVYQPLQTKVAVFMKQVNTPNARFNALFKAAIQMDNSLFALNMLLKSSKENRGMYLIQSKDFLNVPYYYKSFLKENRLKSANILQLAEGNDYANLYAKFSLNNLDDTQRKQIDDADRVKLMMNATTNDTLKSFVLKSQLEELELNVSNYSEFRETFMPYQKYAGLSSVKRKYDGLLKMFVADTAFIGKSAYDFALPDVNGKMVSMKDFAGKVVLIDVWATWCGPCKAQMPFLKEVEEHYKGNDNIVFVGISLDAEKDKQKWLNMIKEKELEGVQLLDDIGKSFGRKYKAVSIPRFFLIDKKGNWAEVRCPLPENTEKLKKYIDKELKRSI